MATITTTASGNWSDAGTWVGGVPPTTGDIADIDHDVTVTANATCDGLDFGTAGVTLTLNTNVQLTGMNTSVAGGNLATDAIIYLNPGALLQWNSASIMDMGHAMYRVRASSLNRATIENTGAGVLTKWNKAGGTDFEFCNFRCGSSALYAGSHRWIDSDIESGSGGYTNLVWLYAERCWISGFSNKFEVNGPAVFVDCVFGEDIDGNPQANGKDLRCDSTSHIYMFGARLESSTQFELTNRNARIFFDDLGYAGGSGTRGVGGVAAQYWIAQRSASAAKAGSFGMRIEPESGIDPADEATDTASGDFRPCRISMYVPIDSGDDVTVSGYGRRHGLSTDCAKLILDPEGIWFTTAEHQPTLTNADQWYEFTLSDTGASGSSETGSLRIELYMDDYQAATDYFDFADFTITCGSVTYTCDFSKWSLGEPLCEASVGGGGLLTHPGMAGGMRG